MILCSSGFAEHQKEQLNQLAQTLGAVFSGVLMERTTHLVTTSPINTSESESERGEMFSFSFLSSCPFPNHHRIVGVRSFKKVCDSRVSWHEDRETRVVDRIR
jgi:hypothetical protein